MDRLRRFLWNPMGWIVFQVLELIVVGVLFRLVLPNTVVGSEVIAFVLLCVVLFVINLWIRRRFIPAGGPGDPLGPSAGP